MDKRYNENYKAMHRMFKYGLDRHPNIDTTTHKEHCRLLRRKKCKYPVIRRELLSLLHTSPKTFLCIHLPSKKPLDNNDPSLDGPMSSPSKMFLAIHPSKSPHSLPVATTSSPTFSREPSTSKHTNLEGLHSEFLKHGWDPCITPWLSFSIKFFDPYFPLLRPSISTGLS
jgi:hypothetical protein